MVSCGLLAKTVKASQSMVRVKPESMESIELLYGALWVAPPCYQDGGQREGKEAYGGICALSCARSGNCVHRPEVG